MGADVSTNDSGKESAAFFRQNGYHLVKGVLNDESVQSLIRTLERFDSAINHYGIRDLMRKVPQIQQLAHSHPLLGLANEVLGGDAKPVRSVFFDKTPNANWNVAWHQDTSIALKQRIDTEGFNHWSEKQGIPHVEPPEALLAQIVTLRIHLDSTDSYNGVLRLLPCSHKNGRVASQALIHTVEASEACVIECAAAPGDVLLMSPLLFHSSRKATSPNHRRIIHIEYCNQALPNGLEWYEQ